MAKVMSGNSLDLAERFVRDNVPAWACDYSEEVWLPVVLASFAEFYVDELARESDRVPEKDMRCDYKKSNGLTITAWCPCAGEH